MKILHVADLHLKPIHKFSCVKPDHIWDEICELKLKVLRKIPEYALKLKADIVTFGGDIFDNSNPPEALKAEFCKILNSFDKSIQVHVISGKPGDHDFISEKNYVLMDLREAYLGTNITIHDTYHVKIAKGVLLAHVMMDGISKFYTNVVEFSDNMFKNYKTILLGDYHAYWKKTYSEKLFVYPAPPYPTRYGESQGGFIVVDVDKTGKTLAIKRYGLKSYELKEVFDIKENLNFETPTVVKFTLEAKNLEVNKLLHKLALIKEKCTKEKNVIDVIWRVKAKTEENKTQASGETLLEVCKNMISESKVSSDKIMKVFNKLMGEV
jgi:DNA repair exonuclease SbcCD nuclease subunit